MTTSTSSTLASPPIFNLMTTTGSSDYYSDGFRQMLEDHMTYLRSASSTKTVTVTPQQAWQNDQDLFGYLQSVLSMPQQYHWVTMRLNDFTSPDQFGPATTSLLIPSATTLEQLRSAYATSSTLTT